MEVRRKDRKVRRKKGKGCRKVWLKREKRGDRKVKVRWIIKR